MSALLKFLAAFALVAVLGLCAVRFDAAPGSISAAQRTLEQSARAQIGAEDANWASVRIDGQKAVLSGEAPTVQQREALIARVAAAQWSGGIVVGGVTAIDTSELTVASPFPLATPYIFIAEHEGDVVSFSGSAPDAEARDRIMAEAQTLFPDAELTGGLEIANGAPTSSAEWSRAALTAMRALSHLRRGVVQSENERIQLTGEAVDPSAMATARALFQDLPGAMTGSTDISVRPAPSTIEDVISNLENTEAMATEPVSEPGESETGETLQTMASPPTPSVSTCLTRLNEAINAHKIGFNSARTDIDNASREHLRRLADRLSACPEIRLRITGHTDSSGNAARNRQLSGYRADAVRAYMISVGAPAERLSTRGAGSSEPVADNRTPAGRERNRRIEIDVIDAN